MAKSDKELVALLEPEVEGLPPHYAAPMSTAISMRRIADFLAGSSRNSDVVDYFTRRFGDVIR